MTALAGQDQPRAAADQDHRREHPGTAHDRVRRRQAPEKKPAGPRPATAPTATPKKPAAAQPPSRKPGPRGLTTSTFASVPGPRWPRPKSPFLVTPGASPEDRYGPDGAVDWSEIPPWRQTSFFGIRARGQFFVYVVDCSGSMIDDDRMPRATIELRRSVLRCASPSNSR